MKCIKHISAIALTASILVLPLAGFAGEDKKSDLIPYKLDKCVVSGEKLGEMGKPVVYEYKGQEIKFCCKNCRKDFDKEPEKYIKKMHEEEKKLADKKPKGDK